MLDEELYQLRRDEQRIHLKQVHVILYNDGCVIGMFTTTYTIKVP